MGERAITELRKGALHVKYTFHTTNIFSIKCKENNYINVGDLLMVPCLGHKEHACSLSVKEIRHPVAYGFRDLDVTGF